ncbi:MAG: hypothetical protein KKI09_03835 [Spirochaetes bacterium]|nr:hypothetical protein [Spirochaetota bacterium]MBU0954538.1 hypothetical protein [Spirochaetota bacterium]
MTQDSERRIDQRSPSFARILFEQSDVFGYLADVSPPGFRVRTIGLPASGSSTIQAVENHEIGLVFEEAGVPFFHIIVSIAWQRVETDSLLLGCKIESFPTEEARRFWQKILEVYTQGDTDGPSSELIIDQ